MVLGVYGASVSIVCAHLSAKSLEDRRRDCRLLFSSLAVKLGRLCSYTVRLDRNSSCSTALQESSDFDLTDLFDHCIFLGDLNYRVVGLSDFRSCSRSSNVGQIFLLFH